MGATPTQNAVAGKFQSKGGDDLVQYLNAQGQVVLWVDSDGVLHIVTTAMQANGSSITTGVQSGG
jgi:hypothetical protein